MNDASSGIRVDARLIPHPTSVSHEARAALRRLVGDDGVPLNSLYNMPDVEDHAGWMAVKQAADQHYAVAMKGLAGSLRSGVETRSIGDSIVHVATPKAQHRADLALIDLHGGALVVGGGDACRVSAQMQSDQHGVCVYGIDYRMPPEHPYPAALDDCLAVYRSILEQRDPTKIIICGRSAGGNLAVATLLRCREAGLPFPAALVLLSPEVDLTESGDSFQVNQMVDVVLPRSLMANNLLYANGADLTDPLLSPLFGDFADFPPTFVQSGTRDLFLSNSARLHRALRRASVHCELHVFEGMPHGGFMGDTPEDRELADEIRRFVQQIWSKDTRRSAFNW